MPTFPVVVGLAVGVAFAITFSVPAGPTFPTDIETRHVILAIDDLKDMPGRYSVIASYEGASMEKKFSVQ